MDLIHDLHSFVHLFILFSFLFFLFLTISSFLTFSSHFSFLTSYSLPLASHFSFLFLDTLKGLLYLCNNIIVPLILWMRLFSGCFCMFKKLTVLIRLKGYSFIISQLNTFVVFIILWQSIKLQLLVWGT